MAALDLITLDDYFKAIGTSPGDADDEEIDSAASAIKAASAAIRNYTSMKFEVQTVGETPTQREYLYDGSGVIDIDEATSITGVVTNPGFGFAQYTLQPEMFTVLPFNGPIYTFIAVSPGFGGASPLMGFERNLDRYGVLPQPNTLLITGMWGWPEIPADVAQAVVWTAKAIEENPGPYLSESIESYSRSSRFQITDSITDRAKTVLAPYIRMNV